VAGSIGVAKDILDIHRSRVQNEKRAACSRCNLPQVKVVSSRGVFPFNGVLEEAKPNIEDAITSGNEVYGGAFLVR